MDEVCSEIESTFVNELKSHWQELFNQNFAELISGGKLQPQEIQLERENWWQRIQPHLETWSKRQAGSICRKHARNRPADQKFNHSDLPEADIAAASGRLYHAVRQLILVQKLIEGEFVPKQEKRLREELWLELAPQVERIAHCYQKSAAKRGFEVDDLIQDASAHFQQVITRFNPQDPRRAMLATWFDDVVDNLFAAQVRPRKSDTLKRGVGETNVPESSDETPKNQAPSLRDVRDSRRQQEMEESLRQVDEICCQLVETGACPFERVLAFKLYFSEGLTYQEVAQALKSQGYHYGTTQTFNFVKEVKAHVLAKVES